MKKRLLLSILLITVLLVTAIAVAACNSTSTPDPGPETGIYYCDTDTGTPHIVQLYGGNKFTFSLDGEIKDGTYSIKNNALSFSFRDSKEKKIENATLTDDILSLSYGDRTLRLFKTVTRTVTFESNGGSAIAPQLVQNGKPMSKPESDPVRENYIFIGWYIDSSFTTTFIFNSQIVTSDMKLYACWDDSIPDRSEFLIDFDLNYDGAPNNPESVHTKGGKLYESPVPDAREGMVFKGWWVSMYDNPEMLSYRMVHGSTIFEESTTLYAIWQASSAPSSKPIQPMVDVSPTSVRWDPVPNAASYTIVITNPAGETVVSNSNITPSNTSFSYNFTDKGQYIITVTAVGFIATDRSEPSVRYYKSMSLARVSLFTVVNSSFLLFNEVANASKYLISIDCGNKFHNHDNIDNGKSTSYNFTNCEMQEDGIKFVVTAVANNGMLSSQSKEFVYNKSLLPVTSFMENENESISWSKIPYATEYMVSIKIGETVKSFSNGTKTTLSLKEYDAGNILISVTPQTAGYNSPAPATYTYEKTTLASPKSIALIGNTVSWSYVSGASNYTIKIGPREIPTTTTATNYPLNNSDLSVLNLLSSDYELSVRANGTSSSSLFSDPVIVRNTKLDSVAYFGGVASWKYVLGAAKYSVAVNGGAPTIVNDSNSAPIEFKSAGVNTITVTALDENSQPLFESPARIEIIAYSVTFSTFAGTLPFDTLYKSFGDPVDDFPNAGNSERPGHIFEGWYTAPGGAAHNAAKYNLTSFFGGDIVLYAFWMSRTYTISLDAGIGSINVDTADVVYNKHFTLPVPQVNGNGFIGWYSAPDGDGVQHTNERGVSTSTWDIIVDDTGYTVYAHYGEVMSFIEMIGDVYSVAKGPDMDMVTTVIIPDMYNGKRVTSLNSFSHNLIENIHLGRYISNILDETFNGCSSLANITVSSLNSNYSDANGILCNKNKTKVLRFPAGRTHAEIPKTITTIAARSFKNAANLVEITIPFSVTDIEADAFTNCVNLLRVNLSTGLENIGDFAFADCSSLKQINLPSDLVSIGEKAFSNCTSLQSITFKGNSTVPLRIFDSLFSDCPSLREVIFEEGSMLNAISARAFSGLTNLKTITIPKSVKRIEFEAFLNCSGLEEIIFEADSNLDFLGSALFQGATSLESVVFNGSTKLNGIHNTIFLGAESIKTIVLPSNITSIADNSFIDCVNLEDFTLPSILASFSSAVFTGCQKLQNIFTIDDPNGKYTSIGGILFEDTTLVRYPLARAGILELPSFVSKIGDGAFNNCDNITGIKVPEGHETFSSPSGSLIGDSGQTLLYFPVASTEITFEVPSTVTRIAPYAFNNNRTIQSITFETNSALTAINDFAFNNCSELKSISFPSSLKDIGVSVFNGCSKLSNITIPQTAETISANTYAGLVALTTVSIPSNVVSIEDNAFYGCTGLQNVLFEGESKLEKIGAGAFQNTKLLSSINFPSKLKTIGNNAFQGSGIDSVTIPNTVTTIGSYAFAEAKKITSVLFKGGNAEQLSIGNNAFSECTSIKTVDFELGSNVQNIGAFAFSGIANSFFETIEIPSSVKNIGNNAFYQTAKLGSDSTYIGLKTVKFNEGLQTIGNRAFEHSLITQIVIPSTVQTIGDYAFYKDNATDLSARLPSISRLQFDKTQNSSALTRIGAYAFYGASELRTTLELPPNLLTIGDFAFFSSLSLPNITFPSTLTSIGSGAFQECISLTSLTFPESLTSIGSNAFSGNHQITSTNLNASFAASSELTTIGQSAFAGCVNIGEEIVIPNSVTAIGSSAFENCIGIKKLTLSNKLTLINVKVFKNTGITSILIPAGVRTISEEAFLPSSIAYINTLSFEKNSQLISLDRTSFVSGSRGPRTINEMPSGILVKDILAAFPTATSFGTVAASNPTYTSDADGVLFDKAGTTLVCYPPAKSGNYTVPDRVIKIADSSFRGATGIRSVSFGANSQLTLIEDFAFTSLEISSGNTRSCGITGITIPKGLLKIGKFAFANSSNFKAFNIPEDSVLYEIGDSCFENTGLQLITIPDALQKIGTNAYFGCNILSVDMSEGRTDFVRDKDDIALFDTTTNSVICILKEFPNIYEFPEGINSIAPSTFKGTSIKQIKLHAGVTSIGNYAFQNTKSLTTVTLAEGSKLTSIGVSAFQNSTITTFKLNEGLKTIGASAFSHSKIMSITLPNSVETIGNSAFNECRELRVLSISPASKLRLIGNDAFNYADKLSEFYFPPSLTSIGNSAFIGVQNITGEVRFPSSLLNIGQMAFLNSKINRIVFEDNSQLRGISESAFSGSSNLESVDFGRGSQLRTIGPSAFSGCSNSKFTSITLPANLETISKQAFNGCSYLANFYTEANSVNFYAQDGVLLNSARNTLVRFPSGRIGTSYIIPNGITTIRSYSFIGFIGTLTIPYSVTHIQAEVFTNATATINVIGRSEETVPTTWTKFWNRSGITMKWNTPQG